MMMNRKITAYMVRYRVMCALTVVICAILAPAAQSQGKEITDMFGRKFSISNRPQKVYSPSPPMTNLLYAIDPSMLAGLNVPVREHEKRYLRAEMQSLPILGGWFGEANTPNIEMILKVRPEIVIVQNYGSAFNARTNETVMKAVPSPVVSVNLTTISDYPKSILYLGRLLGRETRAKALAAYAQNSIADMKTFTAGIEGKKNISVYYAEGVDGLNTECDTSIRTELINLARGRNVHHCQTRDRFGMEKVSFEQVMIYNPDVILVFEDAFHRAVFTDARWRQLRAVKNKRVYLIPNQPFNWFDRPMSFMRLLGAKWLANLLYPECYRINIVKETQQFFRLFFGVNLKPQEAREILRR